MKDIFILYNPKAGNGHGKEIAEKLSKNYEDCNVEVFDATLIKDYKKFAMGLDENQTVILCGGDGTINHYINSVSRKEIGYNLMYYSCGSGNDFLRDIGKTPEDCPIRINEYVKDLPSVTVNGKMSYFINGVGYGIDGYCCEEGDKLKARGCEKVNYTGIAIKGLLFSYKPTDAIVEVDGKEYAFKKVWLAPTMNGRYYGGGMMATPEQDRLAQDKSLTLMVFHGSGKLRTLTIFPSIFKGEHVKNTKHVTILTGKRIKVTFKEPRPAQIDGETVKNVTTYTAVAH